MENNILKNLKLSGKVKTGLTFVALYLALILFFILLMLTSKDGGWALVPIGLVTIFPFLVLILIFVAYIAGEQIITNASSNMVTLAMIIGGLINASILFWLGYLASKIFGKKSIR